MVRLLAIEWRWMTFIRKGAINVKFLPFSRLVMMTRWKLSLSLSIFMVEKFWKLKFLLPDFLMNFPLIFLSLIFAVHYRTMHKMLRSSRFNREVANDDKMCSHSSSWRWKIWERERNFRAFQLPFLASYFSLNTNNYGPLDDKVSSSFCSLFFFSLHNQLRMHKTVFQTDSK